LMRRNSVKTNRRSTIIKKIGEGQKPGEDNLKHFQTLTSRELAIEEGGGNRKGRLPLGRLVDRLSRTGEGGDEEAAQTELKRFGTTGGNSVLPSTVLGVTTTEGPRGIERPSNQLTEGRPELDHRKRRARTWFWGARRSPKKEGQGEPHCGCATEWKKGEGRLRERKLLLARKKSA